MPKVTRIPRNELEPPFDIEMFDAELSHVERKFNLWLSRCDDADAAEKAFTVFEELYRKSEIKRLDLLGKE